MTRRRTVTVIVSIWLTAGLGLYEIAAKSPGLTGIELPGWRAADKAERSTRWRPPTGLFPLDKLLHEGEEAVRFYATLAGYRSPRGSELR